MGEVVKGSVNFAFLAKHDPLLVQLASLAERYFKLVLDSARQQLEKVAVSAGKLAKLNDSILAKAFRGELIEQDPNDEPASVLLERIRVAREAAKPVKKKRSKRRVGGKKNAEI